MPNKPKTFALIILDGWGERKESQYNPIKAAQTPNINELLQHNPVTYLAASGLAVGLPDGQIGNSEVGHLHIGAGRKILQDLTRINAAINQGSFQQNTILLNAIQQAKQTGAAIHILGLVSPGGVHSHEDHIMALINLLAEHGINNYLHAFLDGRDVPPQSAKASLTKLSSLYNHLGCGKIATLIGRYYAMDRDNRWNRTEQAYNLLIEGAAHYMAKDALQGLAMAYERGETDEFVKSTVLADHHESAVTIKDGDIVIFMNFRADRARQLSNALTQTNFSEFQRSKVIHLGDFITLAEYSKHLTDHVIFPPISLTNGLGEFLSAQGCRQLRIAETEKYAHVTYFLNGGQEQAFPGEERLLVPSPKVATYDLQPQMSAIELTDRLVDAIENGNYDAIICNYANFDMIGHTGINAAAIAAIEVIDTCIKRIIDSLNKVGGEALITADHGNIEQIFDPGNQQPHTAHTNNPVPLVYIGRPAQFNDTITDAALDDIAPTLLYLMGFTAPPEMAGRNLITLLSPTTTP